MEQTKVDSNGIEFKVRQAGSFDYVKYDERATEDQAKFKKMFQEIESELLITIVPGRARSLVLTKLEEAYAWLGKAIRDDQVARNASTELMETRSNS